MQTPYKPPLYYTFELLAVRASIWVHQQTVLCEILDNAKHFTHLSNKRQHTPEQYASGGLKQKAKGLVVWTVNKVFWNTLPEEYYWHCETHAHIDMRNSVYLSHWQNITDTVLKCPVRKMLHLYAHFVNNDGLAGQESLVTFVTLSLQPVSLGGLCF